ncbi:hypothetical protein Bbelb_406940 [Branchiostoma belcheri]|nr:hypothetical protein Bbelb_406940 [Branchiostoma belcheri]
MKSSLNVEGPAVPCQIPAGPRRIPAVHADWDADEVRDGATNLPVQLGLHVTHLAQLLRDACAGALFNKHETNEADLNDLQQCLDHFYNLYCLFLPESGNLTETSFIFLPCLLYAERIRMDDTSRRVAGSSHADRMLVKTKPARDLLLRFSEEKRRQKAGSKNGPSDGKVASLISLLNKEGYRELSSVVKRLGSVADWSNVGCGADTTGLPHLLRLMETSCVKLLEGGNGTTVNSTTSSQKTRATAPRTALSAKDEELKTERAKNRKLKEFLQNLDELLDYYQDNLLDITQQTTDEDTGDNHLPAPLLTMVRCCPSVSSPESGFEDDRTGSISSIGVNPNPRAESRLQTTTRGSFLDIVERLRASFLTYHGASESTPAATFPTKDVTWPKDDQKIGQARPFVVIINGDQMPLHGNEQLNMKEKLAETVLNWHKATDGRGLDQRTRRKYNMDIHNQWGFLKVVGHNTSTLEPWTGREDGRGLLFKASTPDSHIYIRRAGNNVPALPPGPAANHEQDEDSLVKKKTLGCQAA